MEYGLQLYSVRDLTEQDFEGALREVARLGYKFVEFAGFFGYSAKEVREMLDRYGLKVSGAHTGLGELTLDKLEETIAYHKALGNTSIIIPWWDFPTSEKLEELITALNEIQPRLAAEGIRLGYHNHAQEFRPMSCGGCAFDALAARTAVEFEIDTYWAYAAGVDPIALLERLGDRARVIHLKDGLADGSGRALGEGTAPVEAVRAYAIEKGLAMVVESETCDPSGIEEVGRCIRYLNALEA